VVKSYKYLGLDINTELDGGPQWERLSSLIRPNIALLRQLRRNGLAEPILVNVFKSLVLSHLRYSSIILYSCSDHLKREMQIVQNKMLRAIGITRKEALDTYSIFDVCDFLKESSIAFVTRVLNTPGHPLPLSIKAIHKSHYDCPFTIPSAKTERFNSSAVMMTLRCIRDTTYNSRTAAEPTSSTSSAPNTQLARPNPVNGGKVQCPECRTWLQCLDNRHLRWCKGSPVVP